MQGHCRRTLDATAMRLRLLLVWRELEVPKRTTGLTGPAGLSESNSKSVSSVTTIHGFWWELPLDGLCQQLNERVVLRSSSDVTGILALVLYELCQLLGG